MTLIAFPLVCGSGAALAWLSHDWRRIGPLVGLAALAAASIAALLIRPGDTVTIGDVRLAGSTYASGFLAVVSAAGFLMCAAGLATGWSDRLVPAALAAFGGLGVALTATDPAVALAAAAAAAGSAAIVTVRSDPTTGDPDNRVSEARTLAVLVGSLLFAAIAVSRPSWAAQDEPVMALGFLGVSVALAIRGGSIPFHLPAARLGKRRGSMAPALLLVWIPAAIGLLAVSWSVTTFGAGGDWLSAAIAAVQVVAVATIVLGAIGAILHRELMEVAVYSIVADSGFILLALASRDAGAASPARLWLLVFIAAKTALVAWAAAVARSYGTSDLGELHGWLRRTPILGLGLVAIAVATIGWPGGAVYAARSTLIDLGLPDRLHLLGPVAIVLSLAYFGRVLLVGMLAPGDAVKAARSELPRLSLSERQVAATAQAASVDEAIANADAPPAEVSETAESAASTPKPKRRKSRAAAAAVESAPTSVSKAEVAAPAGSDAAAAAVAGRAAEAADPTRGRPPGPSLRARATAIWAANRTLEVSVVVLASAALAVVMASGSLGASAASGGGIPFETAAHAMPTPSPTPTPLPTPSAAPTLTPLASHNPRPSESVTASAAPSTSAGPSRSAAPVPVPRS